MRETGLWTYAWVNLAHILSVSALFGAVLVLDLRLVGVWRGIPLSAISRPTVPIAGSGFAVAVLTGIGLLATKATEYSGNPFLLIKFAAIFLGLINVLMLQATAAWKQHTVRELTPLEQSRLRLFGGVSLLSWLAAATAGRMIAYW